MVQDGVFDAEVLEHLHFHIGELYHFFWVDHRVYHIWQLRQKEWCQAFNHKVKAVDLVAFLIDYLSLNYYLRLQVLRNPVNKRFIAYINEERKVFKDFLMNSHHEFHS